MTINGSTNNNNWTYKLEVIETATDVPNRTSTVQVKTYIGRASSRSYIGGAYTNKVTVAGEEKSESGSIPANTYINAGEWYLLQTFTFTVPNKSNPTIISISSTMSSSIFTPSYASASGSMQLTILHLDPTIEAAEMVETNSILTSLGVPNTTVVPYLSKKKIILHATATDEATLSYRLEHYAANYNIPTSGYQSSNVFNTDYTANGIAISNTNKAKIIQKISDSLGGTATDWLYVTINNQLQEPNAIPYRKPIIERTSTSIKRKSGGGINLTDNKATLNLKATFYKGSDVVGNNNSITQIGYKIWASDSSEPSSYTTLTPTISGGNITVSNLEISNVIFTKVYNYKIIIKDKYNYSDIIEATLPTGQSTWNEYKNRVDFMNATIGSNPIVDSGSNTNGSWIKYYDGTMICTKTIENITNNISKAWGNLYESQDAIDLGNMPQTFTELNYINASLTSNNWHCWIVRHANSTVSNFGELYLARPTTGNAIVNINCIAIGKWK